MAPAETGMIRVEVAVGLAPRVVERKTVVLPQGATVRDALVASGLVQPSEPGRPAAAASDAARPGTNNAAAPNGPPTWALIATGQWFVSVWGRRADLDHVVRERDRIELCRQLKVDPKEARRVRYRSQGEKLPKGIHRSPK